MTPPENQTFNSPTDITRFINAQAAIDYVALLRKANEKRILTLTLAKGLIDGNPPYRKQALADAAQSYRSNVNFREAEGFVTLAISAFYDIFSEAPTFTTLVATEGDETKRVEWSNALTEHYHTLEKMDTRNDARMQKSQHEMVVCGTGPMFWDDPMDWRPTALKHIDILVPDDTEADVEAFESMAVQRSYKVGELHKYIKNEAAAKARGWNVEAVKASITKAAPMGKDGNPMGWAEAQQQLRNNDLMFGATCSTVKCAHILYREQDGSVTRVVIDENNKDGFLFHKKSEFECWKHALVMFYYDRGDGSHHSVKGLAVKMYGALEIKNRLKNQLVDAAFLRSQIMLQPADSAGMQGAQIIPKGPLALIPPGSTVIQQNVGGVLDAPMAVDRDLENVVAANLSQYRQRIDKPNGNPRTATEIEAIMAQQSTLGKTQLSRYYAQMDHYVSEKYRRVVNMPIVGDGSDSEHLKLVADFMAACKEAGVPENVIKSARATATRVVGQGNPYLRAQTLTDVLSASGMLSEAGRSNLVNDWLAAKVGQSMVKRYNPQPISGYEQDHAWAASVENGSFKDGLNPPVTGTQNHAIHAQIHIKDGADAHASLQENPDGIVEVAAYLQVILPHIGAHLQQMAKDPTRKSELSVLSTQFNQLMQISDIITRKAQSQSAQPAAGAVPSVEDQIKMETLQRDQMRKDAALKADIERKNKKQEHAMALSDAKTAHALASKGLVAPGSK